MKCAEPKPPPPPCHLKTRRQLKGQRATHSHHGCTLASRSNTPGYNFRLQGGGFCVALPTQQPTFPKTNADGHQHLSAKLGFGPFSLITRRPGWMGGMVADRQGHFAFKRPGSPIDLEHNHWRRPQRLAKIKAMGLFQWNRGMVHN